MVILMRRMEGTLSCAAMATVHHIRSFINKYMAICPIILVFRGAIGLGMVQGSILTWEKPLSQQKITKATLAHSTGRKNCLAKNSYCST